jgi:hypothetical protein
MRHPLRAIALALALSSVPACAHLPSFENPIAAAQSVDQRAYALLRTYAVVLEEATDIVRDPNAPATLKRALGQAERIATLAAETLGVAVRAYVGARADLDASDGAATAFAIAANRLAEAVAAAQAPISQLEALVRQRN